MPIIHKKHLLENDFTDYQYFSRERKVVKEGGGIR